MRLLKVGRWRLVGGAVAVVAVGIAIVFALKPVLFELDNVNLLIFFVGIVALNVFAGVPIAFSVVAGQLGDCRPMLLPSLSRMIAK